MVLPLSNVQVATRRLCRARRSVAALEFALVALPFLLLLLGVMELGYDLYAQTMLDYALDTAARAVQVGNANSIGTSGESSASFTKSGFCPYLVGLDCGAVAIAVQPLTSGTNYFTTGIVLTLNDAIATQGCIDTGIAGQLMLAQAWYVGPTFLGALVPGFAVANTYKSLSYQAPLVHITMSSAGFVNEAFTGGQTSSTPCG